MKVKLSELYDIGSSKRVFQSEWREEGVPFYRAREIAKLSTDGYVDNELFIDEELYVEYIGKYGKPEIGDVMVTGVGTLGVCYVVKPNDKFYFKDGNILWFRQKAPDKILSEYLVKAFDSKDVKEFIEKNSSGTTVGTFTIQTAKKMELSLPTIEEQKNIICKISKIENIIKQRKRELSLLDNLIKARFVELFGTLNDNEKGLDIVSIEELCTLIKDGTHQTPTYTEDKQNGFKFLSSKDVMTQKICWDDIKYIPAELHEKLYATIQPQRNDILMSKNGVNYGVAAVNDTDEVFDIYVSLALLRPRTDMVNPVYLRCAINNPDTKRQFDSSIKGIGVPNLHLGEIKKTNVLLPPIGKQNEFVAFVEQTDKSKVVVQKALNETQLLFDSLMQKYFG